MKTKYWWMFVFLGLGFAAQVGSEAGSQSGQRTITGLLAIIWVIVAVLLIGYGFKLRRLAKKGIEDTRSN